MNTTFLLLGGNLGDVSETFDTARTEINKIGTISQASSLYSTKAWGKTDQPDFLNQVLRVEMNLDPFTLLHKLLDLELQLGRVRKEHWGERLIDIDILFYNSDIIDCEGLNIPHPHLHERMFTLVPLEEINPTYIHPTLNKSISDLVSDCSDNLTVNKI